MRLISRSSMMLLELQMLPGMLWMRMLLRFPQASGTLL
jgi:hypothetical protein